jgi:hypothetical protein
MHKALLLIPSLILAACGGSTAATSPTTGATATTAAETTTSAAAASPLLQADLIGGCFMMGPNCARYVIASDGTVEVYRLGNDAPELLWTATIDTSLAEDVAGALAAADLDEVRSRLGPGTCNACVDGIDTVLTFFVGGEEVVFDSAQVEFDTAEPVFITAALAVQAATASGEIPILSR